MKPVLRVEYFDTDTSSYRHCLELPLKGSKSFRVVDAGILEIDHADGTTRNVPLSNVKQYFETVAQKGSNS